MLESLNFKMKVIIAPSWDKDSLINNKELTTITSNNMLILNLNHCNVYGHIYSEVFSELFAVDETYKDYDCIITVISPLMINIINVFNLKLSDKIRFIPNNKTFVIDFKTLKIVNHCPRSYVNKIENVEKLKKIFHSARPIQKQKQNILLYCSRNTPSAKHGRRLTQENENQIIEILKEFALIHNLEFYLLTGIEIDDMPTSISKQYELFSQAELVVGPHGAVFSNLIFLDLEKNPRVIEFYPMSAKSFDNLFDGAISKSVEYHSIPYQFSFEKKGMSILQIIQKINYEESTIDLSKLKELLPI
jgi:capsular polysaccharide biosynthesis protein